MGRQEESGNWGRDGKKAAGKSIDKHQGLAIWNAVLNDARQITSADDYNKWIKDLRFVAEVNNSVLIAARDQLTFDRISGNHRPMLKRVWRKTDPKGRSLEIACWKDIPVETRELAGDLWSAEQETRLAAQQAADTEAAAPSSSDLSMTFDTLIVGDTNKRAVRLAEQFVEGNMLRAEISFIYGRQGTGKTHILRAVEAAIAAMDDGRRVTYMTAEEFMTAYVDGARIGDTRDLKAQLRDNDLLLIDDLQWIAGKKKTDEAFFANIRSLTKSGGRVLLTADEAPGDLKGFSQRMRGELLGAATAEVGMPDQEMRREIVRLHAAMIRKAQPNFELSEDMIDRIVSSVRGPGRELCGVLHSLQAETGFGDVDPDMDMVVTVLRRQQGEYQAPTLDNIKRAAMRVFDISKAEIESAKKARQVCHPRQIAMYLCREMTEKSLPQIARAFAKKDHTTVLHAWRKISSAMQSDADMVRDVERVREMVYEIQSEGNG